MDPDDFDTEIDNFEENGSDADPKEKAFKPPKDGSWVPRERLDNVSAKYSGVLSELDRVNAKLNELEHSNTASGKVDIDETLEKFEAGEATAKDIIAAIHSDLQNKMKAELTRQTAQQNAKSNLQAYETAFPELKDKTSSTYQEVVAEYDNLTGMGLADDDTTVLVALRSTLGPLDSDKKSRTTRSKVVPSGRKRETYNEFGGGGAVDTDEKSDDPLKNLTAKQKQHYTRMIDAGMYGNWGDVRKELTWTRGTKKAKS